MYPRVRIATLPTPIHPAPALSADLGISLYIKRDDLTGFALGGNKVRKLEYVLAEAQANGARTLVTVGSLQSNHCRQTAALAAQQGLGCILVLSGEEDPSPNGNLLLDQLFGAKIIWTTRPEREAALQQTFQASWERGERPYLIPLGASSPLGALGYRQAFEEFMAQDVAVDCIVLASSSGGTQAGLVLGAAEQRWPSRVLGISIDHSAFALQAQVLELAEQAAERVGFSEPELRRYVQVNDEYLGAGYAVMGAPEKEAICLFARREGILLDPVYTARAAAGLIGLARGKFFKPGERVLFWHTGGIPALFAQPYAAELGHGC